MKPWRFTIPLTAFKYRCLSSLSYRLNLLIESSMDFATYPEIQASWRIPVYPGYKDLKAWRSSCEPWPQASYHHRHFWFPRLQTFARSIAWPFDLEEMVTDFLWIHPQVFSCGVHSFACISSSSLSMVASLERGWELRAPCQMSFIQWLSWTLANWFAPYLQSRCPGFRTFRRVILHVLQK